jgi:hypothetical protein
MSMIFDAHSESFSAEFILDTSIQAPTELYFHEEIHYPNGYKLSLVIDN